MTIRTICALGLAGLVALHSADARVPWHQPGIEAVAEPGDPTSTITPTEVRDPAALERLRGNSGVTLQWISWDYRGRVTVSEDFGLFHLSGSQEERGGPGRLTLDGDVTEIGSDYFVFDGLIEIMDAPDSGRTCVKTGPSRFEITQNRRYWRLREFEWCDYLTDYIDIYF